MERRREAAGFGNAVSLRASTAVLLDLASSISLPARGALLDAGLHVVQRHSFTDVRKLLDQDLHSLVVLTIDEIEDEHLPQIAGLREMTDVPILIVSETEDLTMRAAAFDAGADEHISPSTGRTEVAARIRARIRRYAPAAVAATSHLRLIELN